MRNHIQAGFIAGVLLASGNAQATDQINESEPNQPIGSAQRIDARNGGVAVSAVLGNITGEAINDVDYYIFYGLEGDVVTFDIDGGMGGTRSVDTVIAIFRSAPGFPLLTWNDDNYTADQGSVSPLDARIDNFRIDISGYYIVGVSNYPRHPLSGGSFSDVISPMLGGSLSDASSPMLGDSLSGASSLENGDYKLIVSGITPQVQQINIEIKPGNNGLAPINPRSKGKIPVALLSSNGFVAMNVDTTSLTFGPTGNESSPSHCGRTGEDVNGDGRLDLVCHFENQQAGFRKSDLEGIVRGKMKWGSPFEGRGFLKVVPEKRGS
jgi:hypothetical protein